MQNENFINIKKTPITTLENHNFVMIQTLFGNMIIFILPAL